MTFRFVAAIVAVALCAPAFGADKAAPRVKTAEVQKLINGIKSNKERFSLYCELVKVREGYQFFVEKQDDPKLKELDKQVEELNKKLGPDFSRIAGADLDEEGDALFADLAETCPSSI